MALFVATKARVFVTLATAGAMIGGVAGLEAQARETAIQEEAAAIAAAEAAAPAAPAPTPTTVVKKKKKKKKKATVVVVQAPVVQKKAVAKNHGTSSGSK